MKILGLLSFLFCFNSRAAIPSFRWATSAGGMANLGEGVTTDIFGDILICGGFPGTISFANTNLTSRGGDDIFLAKYNRSGALVWARQAGGTASAGPGTSGDASYSVATDGSGNIFVSGYFSGTATFGNSSNLTSSGGNDIYLAKYDKDGNLLWAKRAGGANHDTGLHIKVDSGGNCYLSGFYRSTASFGGTNLIVAAGNPTFSDLYLAKYDPAGNVVWAKSAGGNLNDVSYDVAIDANTNIFVTGYFQNTATFDTTNVTSAGGQDFFIAKYNSAGTLFWVQSGGGTGADLGRSAASDGTNVYVTASFQGTATFGPTNLTSYGGSDVALLKYDGAGTLLWAQQIGGPGNDDGTVAIDGLGNLYLTGTFSGSATFGSTNLTATNLASDIYVAKYTANGNLFWAKRAGGSNADSSRDIAVDVGQNVYITGNFAGNASFDSASLSSTNSSDIFLARINPDPPLLRYSFTQNIFSLLWSTNWQAILETSNDLGTSAVWDPVTNAVSVVAGQNTVTNASNRAHQFYRLYLP
ncbi:MAG: SBBP repeat-containing protein [Limisphaerales bacterium]